MSEIITEEQLNKFKEISKGEIEQKIIKFINDFINKEPSDQDLNLFGDLITESDEKYITFVIFVDCFNRQSKSFKLITKYHTWLRDNHTKYSQYFKRIIDHDKKLYKILDEKDNHSLGSNIDSLILTEGE